MTDDITLPEDTRRSRLPKPAGQVIDEEFVTADQRFAAFREQYPDGYVGAVKSGEITLSDGGVTFIMHGFAYKKRPAGIPVPEGADADAWAQGSTNSESPIIAGSPLESADTIARSRALRFLGILDGTTRPRGIVPMTSIDHGEALSAARERTAGMSQGELARRMTDNGHTWSQATVSRVERGERHLTLGEAQTLVTLVGFGSG